MRLVESECWERVAASRHGVLGTVHPERGVDLVPAVYVLDDDRAIFIPIDTVKAKTTTRLQRLDNLAADPRCTLLIEHYDADWSRLWWVRINGVGAEATAEQLDRFGSLAAARFPQYAEPETVAGGLVIHPTAITGWSA